MAKSYFGPRGKQVDWKKTWEQGGANKPDPNLKPRPKDKPSKGKKGKK